MSDKITVDLALAYAKAMAERDQLAAVVAATEEALDEIAHGAPWGGPAEDHIRFMRSLADKTLDAMPTRAKLVAEVLTAARKAVDGLRSWYGQDFDKAGGLDDTPEVAALVAALHSLDASQENK